MHEVLRNISMEAWAAIQNGKQNPMELLLKKNSTIHRYLTGKEILGLLDVRSHVGDAPERALQLAKQIKSVL